MSGNDLVRLWKDPDERGDAAHPAGDITLDDINGGNDFQLTIVSLLLCIDTLIGPLCQPPVSCSVTCPL